MNIKDQIKQALKNQNPFAYSQASAYMKEALITMSLARHEKSVMLGPSIEGFLHFELYGEYNYSDQPAVYNVPV